MNSRSSHVVFCCSKDDDGILAIRVQYDEIPVTISISVGYFLVLHIPSFVFFFIISFILIVFFLSLHHFLPLSNNVVALIILLLFLFWFTLFLPSSFSLFSIRCFFPLFSSLSVSFTSFYITLCCSLLLFFFFASFFTCFVFSSLSSSLFLFILTFGSIFLFKLVPVYLSKQVLNRQPEKKQTLSLSLSLTNSS